MYSSLRRVRPLGEPGSITSETPVAEIEEHEPFDSERVATEIESINRDFLQILTQVASTFCVATGPKSDVGKDHWVY
jgi:hypothetical protein